MPSATLSAMLPVEITSTSSICLSPMRMMAPFPKSFSIFDMAACRAFNLSFCGLLSVSFAIKMFNLIGDKMGRPGVLSAYTSKSMSNSSFQGKPWMLSCSMNGSGSNSSTFHTPGRFQMPCTNIMAPIMAGTPVV